MRLKKMNSEMIRKIRWTLAGALIGTVLGLLLPLPTQAQVCTSALSMKKSVAGWASWRREVTNALPDGSAVKTDNSREGEIRRTMKTMAKDVVADESTPMMITIPESGTKFKYTVESEGYGTGTIDKISVKSETGLLRLTMLLPVSGHVGPDNAVKWSTNDMYSIFVTAPDGQRTNLVRTKSKGIVTIQEVEVPLVRGQTVRVQYSRDGSAGPGGFIEGRTLDIEWP